MTRETREHLEHCEAAIQEAKRLLAIHGYPDDLRTVMVIGFITQLIEHHEAMLLLIRADKVGSAFALARSPVEGMYRGMWINFAATDAQVARFERNDDIGLTMTQLAQAIDAAYHAGDFFEDLKRRSWDALNSYAHTGVLQLGRRFREHNVEPAYSDGEIFEITTSVTTCILLLIGKFLAVQHDGEGLCCLARCNAEGTPSQSRRTFTFESLAGRIAEISRGVSRSRCW